MEAGYPRGLEGESVKSETFLITSGGLGYGEGSISLDERLNSDKSSEMHIEEIDMSRLDQLLYSGDVLVKVDGISEEELDDDGCGDGRGVASVFMKNDNQEVERKTTSLHRAKIFGGGPVMAGAALLANGAKAESIEDLFMQGIDRLQAHEIDFGGHTDGHATDEKSGCGAIDNAPRIIENSLAFKDEITQNISVLGVDTSGIDEIFDDFSALRDSIAEKPYRGKSVMDNVLDRKKVVKELDGDHKEVAIVLNHVKGYTVNQAKVREASEGKLQVFAVDVWRLASLSERLYPNDAAAQLRALQGMLVYTLSTAATLTKGDLPVYSVEADKTAAVS